MKKPVCKKVWANHSGNGKSYTRVCDVYDIAQFARNTARVEGDAAMAYILSKVDPFIAMQEEVF